MVMCHLIPVLSRRASGLSGIAAFAASCGSGQKASGVKMGGNLVELVLAMNVQIHMKSITVM